MVTSKSRPNRGKLPQFLSASELRKRNHNEDDMDTVATISLPRSTATGTGSKARKKRLVIKCVDTANEGLVCTYRWV
jgi:hypothetical protein